MILSFLEMDGYDNMKKFLALLNMLILLSATSCSYLHNENYLQAAEEATTPNRNFLFASNASLPGRIYMTFSGKEFKPCINTVTAFANKEGIEVDFYQSNHEGDLVDKIQEAYNVFDGIVINPAAYTHTSIALLDAVKAVGIPTVEVHISDVSAREDFRQISFIRTACVKTISGKGINGYCEAILFLKELIG